jgi:hypothetical protein
MTCMQLLLQTSRLRPDLFQTIDWLALYLFRTGIPGVRQTEPTECCMHKTDAIVRMESLKSVAKFKRAKLMYTQRARLDC